MIRRLCWIAIFAGCAVGQTGNDARKAYQTRCVGCHGDDGMGGGHGPAIVGARSRANTMEAVRDVIRRGIPDRGMPAFAVSGDELDAIAGYVMLLKTPAADLKSHPELVSGDPRAGQQFFAGKGQCSSCHMIQGRGGIVGPDLSNVGRTRTLGQLQRDLADPGWATPSHAVTVRLRGGPAVRGIAKNESAFDIQVLGVDGQMHLITKDRVAKVVREKSLMPAADAASVPDLVAYLSSLTLSGTTSMGSGVAFKDIARPKRGDWPTYHGNESGNRFSPLDQINTRNAGRLAPQWMFQIASSPRALEVTPVAVDGIMYVTAVNEAYAIDARSGREIWHYLRPRTSGVVGDAGSGINRGVAILGDRVFMVTDNAHLIALHRLTGQLLWDVTMADYRQNYGSTSAPLVAGDLVVAGVSGGDEGIRGFVDAYQASTGEHAWRFWTVPAMGEPGSETWDGKAIEHGCAATWLTGTYDPSTNLLYWPTGNPCPDYNGDERKGDNLYSSSVLALDPQSGKLKWYYQFTPHDLHDWDATETPVLVDAKFRGVERKLMLQGNRNGFFYVLDRTTGKVLLAKPFIKNLTWASGIGPDGRPMLIAGNEPTSEGQRVCPSVAGAANWPSSAFSASTGLFYMFAEESCTVYSKNDQAWEAGKSFYGGGTRGVRSESDGKFLKAIDIQTGKTAWEIGGLGGGILGSGLMATAGGLLFYGDGNGAFVAADVHDGKALWHFNTNQSFKGGPMTYMVDGKQYVATATGSTIVSFALTDTPAR